MKKTAAGGKTRKHAGTSKHRHTVKHHAAHTRARATAHGHKVHTKATHPHHAKARGLAPGGMLACCAAEAVAMSLRLAGGSVSAADVEALFWLAGGDEDDGAPILAALEAASAFGLGGFRPVSFEEVMPRGHDRRSRLQPSTPDLLRETRAGLILGADLPGPHALFDDGRFWWSWGKRCDPADFPGAVIEEAWAVTW